jgi:hypothetical protein
MFEADRISDSTKGSKKVQKTHQIIKCISSLQWIIFTQKHSSYIQNHCKNFMFYNLKFHLTHEGIHAYGHILKDTSTHTRTHTHTHTHTKQF